MCWRPAAIASKCMRRCGKIEPDGSCEGEKVLVTFTSPKQIALGGTIIVAPLKDTDPLYKLGSDPIPKEELDIADASVNLDKYIYGE